MRHVTLGSMAEKLPGTSGPLCGSFAVRTLLAWALLGVSGFVSSQPVADEDPEILLRGRPFFEGVRETVIPCSPVGSLHFEVFVESSEELELLMPLHIAFLNGYEVITDSANDRLLFRPEGSHEPWTAASVSLESPHSSAFSEVTGMNIVSDTENDRLVGSADLAGDEIVETGEIAGASLNRPHDVVYDRVSEMTFALNPNRPKVFRFHGFGIDEAVLDLGSEANYSRALTMNGESLLVVASTLGKVIEVVDFDQGIVNEYESHGKVLEAYAGSWETTGFVLNDIEFYGGYWYASNFFGPQWAQGTDHNRFKLVRFRTWQELANGSWQDLSSALPDSVIPYFFTRHNGQLYFGSFHALYAGSDAVYRITSGIFFDGFDCLGLERWSAVVGRD